MLPHASTNIKNIFLTPCVSIRARYILVDNMNVEKIIGPGPLKIKYKIISSMDFLYGNICFMHDGVEIGDYDDVVNLNDVHDWLNDFSQKAAKDSLDFWMVSQKKACSILFTSK